MTAITASMIARLRQETGAGMMDCKKALNEAAGDFEQATFILQKQGVDKAAKRSGRRAAEGVVLARISEDQHRGWLVEVNCETDFVSRGDVFSDFANAVADVALAEGVADLEALLAAPMDGGEHTVESKRQAMVATLGENIQVRRVAVMEASAMVGSYTHGGRLGVLVALSHVNADVARDVAMHVAASRPTSVRPEDVPHDVVERERSLYKASAEDSGKPAEIVAKIIEGKVRKFLQESSLLSQPFVKNPDQTVGELLASSGADVEGFAVLQLGEADDADDAA